MRFIARGPASRSTARSRPMPRDALTQHDVADARRHLALEDGDGLVGIRGAWPRGRRRHRSAPSAIQRPALADRHDRVGCSPRPARRSRDAAAPRPGRARACRRARRSGADRPASGVSARKSSAAATLTGDALYVSSTSVAPEHASPPPCGDRRGCRPRALRRPRRCGPRSAPRPPPRPARAARGGGRASRCAARRVPHGAWSGELGAGQAAADDLGRARRRRVGPSPKVRTSAGGQLAPWRRRADRRR